MKQESGRPAGRARGPEARGPRPEARSGFTVVELAVGIGILLFVMAGFVALYFGQAGKAARVGQKADLADEARKAYFRMTEEMKFGIDILQPLVNSAPTPYVLFTDDEYGLIGYWVEKYKPEGGKDIELRRLMRMDFNAKDGRKPEIVAPHLEKVLFTRKGNKLVDVEFAFKDADENVMVMTASISCRNAVAVY